MRLWKVLEVFGRPWVWNVLEGFAGFARFCEALVGFENLQEALGRFGTLCEVLEALDGFVMFWEALALEGFGTLLKSLGGLWEAVA